MATEQASDEGLMADLAGNDMAALGELVRRHQGKVLALAYRVLGRWDQAEDAAQEAFLQVYKAAGTYRPDAKFTTWLYRIVVNLCLDVKRRNKRCASELGDWSAVPAQDGQGDPLEAKERAQRVRQAVQALPERQRTALVLHRYEGLSHSEVSEVTGWSASAVESLLVRAYANLRGALAKLMDGQ